jgi:hypothetical protein
MYYALYNASTNPAGATPAGWYPVSGKLPYFRKYKSDAFTWTPSATIVKWDAAVVEGIEQGLTYSSASGLFTCTQPGIYEFKSSLGIATTASFWYANMHFRKNASIDLGIGGVTGGPAAIMSIAGVWSVALALGDTASIAIVAGANINGIIVDGPTRLTWLSVRYVGPV